MAKSKEKKRKTVTEEEEEEEEEVGRVVEKMEKSKTMDVKIKAIVENPELKTPPIIGYFPSGFDPLKNSGEPDSELESSSGVKVYKSASTRNPKNPRMQVVVGGASGSGVNFVGTNYSGEARTPQLCNYALGVLDKETRILRMIPIAANRIFRLDPKIAAIEQSEKERPDEVMEEATREEMADKFKETTRKYSTKRNIKRDEKRDTLRQTEDPGMEGDMEQKLKGIKINQEAIEDIPSTGNVLNIPPYDIEATVPEKAYLLDGIILKGDWDYLFDIFDLAQSGNEVTPDVYPSFVCNRIHKLKEAEGDWNKRRIAGILSYITHLIKFKDTHSMDGVSSSKNHKFPTILSQRFTAMFDISSKKRISEEKQSLLINYVLVLSLFVDDFKSDPTDIAADLRMNARLLRPYYEYLGCKLSLNKNTMTATLKVPLKFHTIKRKRRR